MRDPLAKASVGSNPTPRTTYVETCGGFVQVMLAQVFRLSEDLATVRVLAGHVLKACFH